MWAISTCADVFLEPTGSMSSMEVNIDVLEQMDLMDISDQEALDVFLNSGAEDNVALSPGSGKCQASWCRSELRAQAQLAAS